MNEEQIKAGLVAFLKARATTLADPIAVIGLGDPVPNEGPRLHIDRTDIEIVAGGLCYFDLDILIVCPAKQADGDTDFTAACGFLRRALPARDATQRDALRAAVLTATSNAITVQFHHHGEPDGEPPVDPHRHQRLQRLRLGLSGSTI
jgi:hypothetical protein